jgi:thymidylate synthase
MKYKHEDGTPFTKEEFLQKLKTDKDFNNEFGNKGIDQIANLINELKTNPDSRRLLVSAWAVHDLTNMVLPPCHYGFQVYTRELSYEERCNIFQSTERFKMETREHIKELNIKIMNEAEVPTRAISLMWNQRSVDTFLGLPFNSASYGLLLEIIAKEVNMVPDELIGNLGDTHLYLNHIEQAKEQIGRELTVEERMDWWFKNRKPNRDVCDYVDELSPYAKGLHFDSAGVPKSTREPYPLPTLKINPNNEMRVGGGIFTYVNTDFTLENYQSHPTIKAPLSN